MFPNIRRDVVFPVGGAVILFALLVGAGLTYQALIGGSAERLVTAMLIDAIIVIGIQIYVGNTGILSFGHVGIGAIAGYAFAVFVILPERKARVIPDAPFGLTDISFSPIVAGIIAIAIALLVALVVGIGLARSGAQSGAVSATVITLALLFVSHEVARNWNKLTGGERAGLSFSIGGTLKGRVAIHIFLLASIVIARLYAQSRSGRLAVAAREDNLAARAMGINPLVQQMATMLISAAVVAVGASLRVYEIGTVLPNLFFFDYTMLTIVMLVVGGRNSVTGALLGVVVITLGREVSRRLGTEGFEVFGLGLDEAPLDWIFREGLPRVFLGLAMVGFMLKRPTGLISDWELDEWLYEKFGRGADPQPGPLPEVAETAQINLLASDIDVKFGGFQALNGAGIAAESGEIVGVIGPNGAGKTTFVNVITGLVEPTSGTFSIDGKDLTAAPTFKLARNGLVRTFQNLRLFGSLTVRENVEVAALIAKEHRSDRVLPGVDALVSEAGLWEHRNRRASELDYGNSRRLELARAAALSPSFMLLDEPTSGMSDTESVTMIEQVRHMAATVGAGVIVIDHDLAFITGISDKITVLDQGTVIATGTPTEVQANPVVQAAYLGSAAIT